MVREARSSDSEESDDDDDWSSSGSSNDTGRSDRDEESDGSSQVVVDEQLPISPGQAAAIIQGMYRRRKARESFVERVRQAYEKVYDEENDVYFYYNKIHGRSQWTKPRTLLGRSLDPREETAVEKMQGVFRNRGARKKMLAILCDIYEREYDPESDAWFYVNKVTKETSWEKPTLFGNAEPPTNTSDVALLNKERELEAMRKELDAQKLDAQEARKALEEKLTEERIRSGALDPDEARGRSRHMDEWSVDEVIVWFHGIGYTQFDANIREHKVDGLLLLHLMNDDWGHLGISSPLTVRRIDVAMQGYRIRFERKQVGGDDGILDQGSDVSGSDTPSELLEEDDLYGEEDDDSGNRDDEDQLSTGDDVPLGEDDPAEVQLDRENMSKEIMFAGEEKRGRPFVGDVVRVHYTCSLRPRTSNNGRIVGLGARKYPSIASEDTVVENSRRHRRRPLEFVVGAGQVIKGIDRSIRTMLYGERATVSISALYGYGTAGYPPTIPPGTDLVFDINLLDFWPRPRWQKPLVQVLSDPYEETPYAPRRAPTALSAVPSRAFSKGTSQTEVPKDEPYGKVGRY